MNDLEIEAVLSWTQRYCNMGYGGQPAWSIFQSMARYLYTLALKRNNSLDQWFSTFTAHAEMKFSQAIYNPRAFVQTRKHRVQGSSTLVTTPSLPLHSKKHIGVQVGLWKWHFSLYSWYMNIPVPKAWLSKK